MDPIVQKTPSTFTKNLKINWVRVLFTVIVISGLMATSAYIGHVIPVRRTYSPLLNPKISQKITTTPTPTQITTNSSTILLTLNISQSTTGTPADSLSIYTDGSAKDSNIIDCQNSASMRPCAINQFSNFNAGSFYIKGINADLALIGDISKISIGTQCIKPVSSPTTITISFNGKTSPDISCEWTAFATSPSLSYLNPTVNDLLYSQIYGVIHPNTNIHI